MRRDQEQALFNAVHQSLVELVELGNTIEDLELIILPFVPDEKNAALPTQNPAYIQHVNVYKNQIYYREKLAANADAKTAAAAPNSKINKAITHFVRLRLLFLGMTTGNAEYTCVDPTAAVAFPSESPNQQDAKQAASLSAAYLAATDFSNPAFLAAIQLQVETHIGFTMGLKLDSYPTSIGTVKQEPKLNQLFGMTTAAYLFYNNAVYYVNKARNICDKVALTPDQYQNFCTLDPAKKIRLLSTAELEFITGVTGHHPLAVPAKTGLLLNPQQQLTTRQLYQQQYGNDALTVADESLVQFQHVLALMKQDPASVLIKPNPFASAAAPAQGSGAGRSDSVKPVSMLERLKQLKQQQSHLVLQHAALEHSANQALDTADAKAKTGVAEFIDRSVLGKPKSRTLLPPSEPLKAEELASIQQQRMKVFTGKNPSTPEQQKMEAEFKGLSNATKLQRMTLPAAFKSSPLHVQSLENSGVMADQPKGHSEPFLCSQTFTSDTRKVTTVENGKTSSLEELSKRQLAELFKGNETLLDPAYKTKPIVSEHQVIHPILQGAHWHTDPKTQQQQPEATYGLHLHTHAAPNAERLYVWQMLEAVVDPNNSGAPLYNVCAKGAMYAKNGQYFPIGVDAKDLKKNKRVTVTSVADEDIAAMEQSPIQAIQNAAKGLVKKNQESNYLVHVMPLEMTPIEYSPLPSPKTITITMVPDWNQEAIRSLRPATISVVFGPANTIPEEAEWVFTFNLYAMDQLRGSSKKENEESIGKGSRALLWENGSERKGAFARYHHAVEIDECKLPADDELKTKSIVLRTFSEEKDPNALVYVRRRYGVTRSQGVGYFKVVQGHHYYLNITFAQGSSIAEKVAQGWRPMIYLNPRGPGEKREYDPTNPTKGLLIFANFVTNWAQGVELPSDDREQRLAAQARLLDQNEEDKAKKMSTPPGGAAANFDSSMMGAVPRSFTPQPKSVDTAVLSSPPSQSSASMSRSGGQPATWDAAATYFDPSLACFVKTPKGVSYRAEESSLSSSSASSQPSVAAQSKGLPAVVAADKNQSAQVYSQGVVVDGKVEGVSSVGLKKFHYTLLPGFSFAFAPGTIVTAEVEELRAIEQCENVLKKSYAHQQALYRFEGTPEHAAVAFDAKQCPNVAKIHPAYVERLTQLNLLSLSHWQTIERFYKKCDELDFYMRIEQVVDPNPFLLLFHQRYQKYLSEWNAFLRGLIHKPCNHQQQLLCIRLIIQMQNILENFIPQESALLALEEKVQKKRAEIKPEALTAAQAAQALNNLSQISIVLLVHKIVKEIIQFVKPEYWLDGVYICFDSKVHQDFYESFGLTLHGKAGGIDVLVSQDQRMLAVQLIGPKKDKDTDAKKAEEQSAKPPKNHLVINIQLDGTWTHKMSLDGKANNSAKISAGAVGSAGAGTAAAGTGAVAGGGITAQSAAIKVLAAGMSGSPLHNNKVDAKSSPEESYAGENDWGKLWGKN